MSTFVPPSVDSVSAAFVEGAFQPISTNPFLWDAFCGADPTDLYWIDPASGEIIWHGAVDKGPARSGFFAEVYRGETALVDLYYIENGEWKMEEC